MASFTTTDGVELHHTDDGDGPPVVLIAGFCAPASGWEFQRRALLAEGHRVICFDRRNHGDSAAVQHGQRMSRHGKDLRELLEHLDLRDVALVGSSMGGSTIWAYCDLFGADRLRAIVTIDQTPKMINDDGWPYGFYGLTRDNVGTFFDKGVPDTGRGKADRLAGFAELVEVLGFSPPFADPADPPMRALLQDHATQDWRDVVARVPVPALFLTGRDSQLWPCEHALAVAESNELASVTILEDCGHAVHLDQIEAATAAIVGFVR
ncbi:alpha/beta hydrolase [Actinoplanes sp. NPDC051633]|uniref:alpha/beta fold hydrolase n=1 Tax=Actinoplanes sp. NPDC051633 TaxID=3155670 RepID=UPI003413BED6